MLLTWMVAILALADAKRGEEHVDALMHEGEECYAAHDYLGALRCFLEAEEAAMSASATSKLTEIYYDAGSCYFMISAHGQALDYFYKAASQCPDDEDGHQMRGLITYGVAGVYYKDGDYVKAREILEPYYRECVEERDSAQIVYFATFMAMIENRRNNFDGAMSYIEQGQKFMPAHDNQEPWVLTIEGSTRFRRGEYDRVEEIWRRLSQNELTTPADLGLISIYMMDIKAKRGEPWHPYAEAADTLITLADRPYYYNVLSHIYKRQGLYSLALSAKDSVMLYRDSLQAVANHELLNASRTQLEVLRYTTDMDMKIEEARTRSYVAMGVGVVAMLLLLLTATLYRSHRASNRVKAQVDAMRIEQETSQRQLAEERLRITELESKMQQEALMSSLKEKERQITASSLFISARNELVESLLKEIEAVGPIEGHPELAKLHRQLKTHLHNADEREDIIVNFEKANPNFYSSLRAKHPQLLQSDITFLSYFRMNMPIKDIATMLNITPDSCKRRKIRVSQKLGLASSADLYAYIAQV